MNKPAVTPIPVPNPVEKTLPQQKSDFTAEGAPPPGKVSTDVPATAPELGKTHPSHKPVRGTISLKRPAVPVNP